MEYSQDELDDFFGVKHKDLTEYESTYYRIKQTDLMFCFYIVYIANLIEIEVYSNYEKNDERKIVFEINLSEVEKIVKSTDGGIDILYSEGKKVHIDNEPNFSVTCGIKQ